MIAVPVVRDRRARGRRGCCGGARRTRRRVACGTVPAMRASAHRQPAVDRVPGAARGRPRCWGRRRRTVGRSVTSGSFRAGDCEEPIRAGPWTLRRGADAGQEAADVGDERARLAAARDAGEERPRLRLAEDRARADAAGRRRSRASTSPCRSTRPHQCAQLLRRGRPQRRGEASVAAQIGELGQARVDVGELGGDQHRLGHPQEGGREVRPVAVGAGGQIAAVRAAQALLVGEGALQVLPERGAAAVAPAQLLVEEGGSRVRQPVLGGGQQQPEVEVVGGARGRAACTARPSRTGSRRWPRSAPAPSSGGPRAPGRGPRRSAAGRAERVAEGAPGSRGRTGSSRPG